MNLLFNYFQVELKRYLKCVKSACIGAIVLALIAGAVAFCATGVLNKSTVNMSAKDGGKVKAAFVINDESRITHILANVLEDSDCISKSCEFIKVSEDKAEKMLKNGEVMACITIPEEFLESVNNGDNYPVDITFSDNSDVVAMILKELSKYGGDILASAQAGIYAQYDFFMNHEGMKNNPEANKYLNKIYLKYVLEREQYFDVSKIKATGNIGYKDFYFCSSIIFVIMMLCLAYPAFYMEKKGGQIYGIMDMKGIIYPVRFMVKTIIPTLFQLPVAMVVMSVYKGDLSLKCVTCALLLFPAVWCCNCMAMLVINMCSNIADSIVVTFLVNFICSLMSGYFIPEVFMPDTIVNTGKILPTGVILSRVHESFRGRISVETGTAILLWCAALCAISSTAYALRKMNIHIQALYNGGGNNKELKLCKTTPLTFLRVFLKRQCLKAGFIFMLVVIPVGAVCLKNIFAGEPVEINVALYCDDEDGIGHKTVEQLVDSENGVIRFVECASKSQLKKYVMSKQCQCGYILPQDLSERMYEDEADEVIKVFTNDKAISAITNEMVFSTLFKNYAPEELCNYIQSSGWFEDIKEEDIRGELIELYENRLGDGSTFSFRYYNENGISQDTTRLLPGFLSVSVKGLLAFVIMIGGMAGTLLMYRYRSKNIFGNRYGINRIMCEMASVASVVIPMVIVCYIAITATEIQSGGTMWISRIIWEMLWIIIYGIAVIVHSYAFSLVIKKQETYAVLIPIMIIAALITCPVIVDMSNVIPGGKYIGGLLPLYWYI